MKTMSTPQAPYVVKGRRQPSLFPPDPADLDSQVDQLLGLARGYVVGACENGKRVGLLIETQAGIRWLMLTPGSFQIAEHFPGSLESETMAEIRDHQEDLRDGRPL